MSAPAVDPHRQILAPVEVPFADLANDFECATRAHRTREFALRIADRDIRIRVVGDAWADTVAAAMGHLERPASDAPRPELNIDVWDVRATGVAVSKRAAADPAAPPILMKGSRDGRFVGEERHHGMTWLDRRNNRIVGFSRMRHAPQSRRTRQTFSQDALGVARRSRRAVRSFRPYSPRGPWHPVRGQWRRG